MVLQRALQLHIKRLNSFIHEFAYSLKDLLKQAGKVVSFGFRFGGPNSELSSVLTKIIVRTCQKLIGNVDYYHIRPYSTINQEVRIVRT